VHVSHYSHWRADELEQPANRRLETCATDLF